MKPALSIKHFLVVFGGAFVTLLAVGLFRGQPLARAIGEAALGAGILSAIFLASRLYRSFRGLDSGL